jgi:hypothetical protein
MMDQMYRLSTFRSKRPLNKSASEQYLYAKALSKEERTALESGLEARMREAGDPAEAKNLMTMWLSVQQARLRTHDDAGRKRRNLEAVGFAGAFAATGVGALWIPDAVTYARKRYYRSPDRPEYKEAFNNFMKIIGDDNLSQRLRQQAVDKLNYHLHSEGTIAKSQATLIRDFGGAQALANLGYRVEQTDFEKKFAARALGRFGG